jgi:hypothetical protein
VKSKCFCKIIWLLAFLPRSKDRGIPARVMLNLDECKNRLIKSPINTTHNKTTQFLIKNLTFFQKWLKSRFYAGLSAIFTKRKGLRRFRLPALSFQFSETIRTKVAFFILLKFQEFSNKYKNKYLI